MCDTPASIASLNSAGQSSARPAISATRGPLCAGSSETEGQKRTPAASASALHAAKSSLPGLPAPAPRNHGSTTSVSCPEGTSPSSSCLA